MSLAYPLIILIRVLVKLFHNLEEPRFQQENPRLPRILSGAPRSFYSIGYAAKVKELLLETPKTRSPDSTDELSKKART